jgi:hypothetical protein
MFDGERLLWLSKYKFEDNIEVDLLAFRMWAGVSFGLGVVMCTCYLNNLWFP